jgi:hypothetical protein
MESFVCRNWFFIKYNTDSLVHLIISRETADLIVYSLAIVSLRYLSF